MNDLRCYVCGRVIPATSFRLVSMSDDADRVFIVDEGCAPRVQDDAKIMVLVERVG